MNEISLLFHAVHIRLCNGVGRTHEHKREVWKFLPFTQCERWGWRREGETRKHLPNNILKMVGCAGVLVEMAFSPFY